MALNPRTIFANFRFASFARVGSALLSFLLFWWLTRKLPHAHVGGFALAMGVYFTVQTLPLLGMHVALVRTSATQPERLPAIVNEHWWFAWPVSIAMCIGLAIYGSTQEQGPMKLALYVLAAAMLPTSWTTVAEATLVGMERLSLYSIGTVAEAAWRLVASAAALALGGELTSVMVVFLIGRICTAIYYARLPELPLPTLRKPPALGAWLALWKTTPVYLGIGLLAALSTRFDILALGKLVSLDQVGIYSAGAKIYEAVLMVPTLSAFVILPALSRLYNEDRDAFSHTLSLVLRISLIVGLPLALIGAAGAPWAVALIFPDAFAPAGAVLQVLLFAAVLATLDVVLSSTMVAANAQAVDFRCMGFALIVLVIATIVLVPRMGITGAAVAVALNMTARVIYRALWATRAMGATGIWPGFVKAAIAFAVSCVALAYASALPWPLAALLALFTYLLVALATGLVRVAHLRLVPGSIHSALRKVL